MKVLGINASPRGSRSNTLKLVKAVLEGAKEKGADVELIDVCKLDIKYCNGCHVCYKEGQCIFEDDFKSFFDKMLVSDGLVWGSPNYIRSVTAQMKTLLDRMADAIHCQRFTGKYCCTVATAGGKATDEVTSYLNGVLVTLGANIAGSVGASMAEGPHAMQDAEKKARELGADLVDAIASKKVYKDQEALHKEIKERFKNLVTANKDEWPHEYEHWLKMGWL